MSDFLILYPGMLCSCASAVIFPDVLDDAGGSLTVAGEFISILIDSMIGQK